jgi:hypothetical protein
MLKQQKYESLWDHISQWWNKGIIGKVKTIAWILCVGYVFVIFLPTQLYPLYNSDFGTVPACLVWLGALVLLQIIGSKLKLEIKD